MIVHKAPCPKLEPLSLPRVVAASSFPGAKETSDQPQEGERSCTEGGGQGVHGGGTGQGRAMATDNASGTHVSQTLPTISRDGGAHARSCFKGEGTSLGEGGRTHLSHIMSLSECPPLVCQIHLQ